MVVLAMETVVFLLEYRYLWLSHAALILSESEIQGLLLGPISEPIGDILESEVKESPALLKILWERWNEESRPFFVYPEKP